MTTPEDVLAELSTEHSVPPRDALAAADDQREVPRTTKGSSMSAPFDARSWTRWKPHREGASSNGRAHGTGASKMLRPRISWWGDFAKERSSVGSALPYKAGPKIGRNDPCPCGSGKKYKKCRGS